MTAQDATKSVKILQEEIINYQEEQIGEREDGQEAGESQEDGEGEGV